jgi:hypothetical protein
MGGEYADPMKKSWACALLCWTMFCGFATSASAQTESPEPIRVESNEVLIPVLVLDKARLTNLQSNPAAFDAQIDSGNFRSWEAIPVRNLTAKDFEVFEDGERQMIESVTPAPPPGPFLRDKVDQYVGPGRGIWTVPEESVLRPDAKETKNTGIHIEVNLPGWPGYVLAYAPSPSSSGKCHQVAVKVNRRDSLVVSRSEYCNVPGAADPLAGTKVGKRLTSELVSAKKSKIPLYAAVFAPPASAGASRVRVFLEFPQKPLELHGVDCAAATGIVDVLGMVYSGDGALAAHFSDSKDLPAGDPTSVGESFGQAVAGESCIIAVPTRYETQLELPAGEYDLRIAYSERGKFGRAEAHFVVEPYDGKYLATSSIALVRHYLDMPTEVRAVATRLPSAFTPLVSKGVDVTPAANANFPANEPLYFHFEVYEPLPTSTEPVKVQVQMRIVDAKSGRAVKNLQPVDAASYAKPGDPVVPIGGGIDLDGLSKGSYLLEAQATDSEGNTTPWRTVNFSIQ